MYNIHKLLRDNVDLIIIAGDIIKVSSARQW